MLWVDELVKQYPVASREQGRRTGVDGVSFEVTAGELFTLLGPSGCGKTTTLRSIAGLEQPDSGRIRLGDDVLFDGAARIDRPANRRGLAMVFQSYAIWPHMSVWRNAAFPLEIAPRRIRPSRKQITERVARALATVGLDGFADQGATRLSGGQQQRLALARALVSEPSVLLLDEPLSNLDAKLRESMRLELKRLQRDIGLTAIYVTHDQAEALSMSSRVAIMNAGKVAQIGKPRDLYGAPADEFVADFLGVTNFVAGVVSKPGEIQTDIGVFRAAADSTPTAAQEVLVCLRPECLTVSMTRPTTAAANEFEGKLVTAAFLGDRVDHVVTIGGVELRVRSHSAVRIRRDATVYVTINPADIVVLPR
jgi:iron(III) transport system ATP-binding protein